MAPNGAPHTAPGRTIRSRPLGQVRPAAAADGAATRAAATGTIEADPEAAPDAAPDAGLSDVTASVDPPERTDPERVERPGDPAPATRRRRMATRKKPRSTDPDDPQPKVTFREANAGPAIWQKVIRWSVALLVVGFAAVGVLRTLNPPQAVTYDDIAGVLDEELGHTGFPIEKGEAFAAEFVTTYFTWSAEGSEERADRLAVFLPTSIPDGWDGQGAQQVVTTPVLSAPVQEVDQNRATYTFSFMIDSGTWLQASVGVYADDNDNLLATGLPALLPGTGTAEFPGNPEFGQLDPEVAEELVAVLPGFFEAWAASDAASLDRFVTADASAMAREGLHGAVIFDSVTDVSVELPADDPDATTRHALATVTWRSDPGEATYSQAYLLTIALVDGRWYVDDITVGQQPADQQAAATEAAPSSATPAPQSSATPAPPSSAAEPAPGLETIPPPTPPGAGPPGPGG